MRISIQEAIDHLNNSNPVAIPTETVWGLAARMDDEIGINRIFELKGRPRNNPLIIHISRAFQLFDYISQRPLGLEELIESFWPGSLTLVVPICTERIPAIVRSGLPTAAFRMPQHALTLSLLDAVGPVVAPSANLSGSPSATTMEHIESDFGRRIPILSSEETPKGIESTILVWSDPVWSIGRLGAVGLEELYRVLNYYPKSHDKEKGIPICPGQLYRHYAPLAKLTLSEEPWKAEGGENYDAVLGFSDRSYQKAKLVVLLGSSDNPVQIAQNLYRSLRSLDDRGLHHVFVDCRLPRNFEYLAIIDRLTKAAS